MQSPIFDSACCSQGARGCSHDHATDSLRTCPTPALQAKAQEDESGAGEANSGRPDLRRLTSIRSIGRHYSALQEEYFNAINDAQELMDLDLLDCDSDEFMAAISNETSFAGIEGMDVDESEGGHYPGVPLEPPGAGILAKAIPPISYRPLSASDRSDISDDDVLEALEAEAAAMQAAEAAQAELQNALETEADDGPTEQQRSATEESVSAQAEEQGAGGGQPVEVGDPEMGSWLPPL